MLVWLLDRCDGCNALMSSCSSARVRTFPVDEVHKHGPEQCALPALTAPAPPDQEVQHVWVQGDVVLEAQVTEDTLGDNTSGFLG